MRFELIGRTEKEKWNYIIKSFQNWDIYYLCEYAESLQIHGDGEPVLIYFEENGGKFAYVMMENDISEFGPFSGILQKEEYFDWTTPYGYGGPLAEGDITAEGMQIFQKKLTEVCRARAVVSQFFRFHPLLQNQHVFKNMSEIVNLKKTVVMDTTADEETIFHNMVPNSRKNVRKAKKNNVQIMFDYGERINDFIRIYEDTMEHNSAEEYYYFQREYFDFLLKEMKDHVIIFYAIYDQKPVSATLFFYNEKYMHYHLAGTLSAYRTLAAMNLLISEAANWASSRGIQKLHLGGGVGTDDSLLSFKKQFTKDGLIDFCIGRNIFIPEVYEELIDLRVKSDQEFDPEKPFLIRYRG